MITIKNLNKSYGKQHVLHDINLTLEQGQCLGLVTPQSGEVLVNGMNVQENQSYRQHIGFMQQNSCFPENMSVRETFRTIQDVRGTNTRLDKELYDAYEIESIAEKKTKTLSGGTSQKVNAALAFLFNPDILILDEPTASLDPLAANILKEKIVKEKNKLVFITSHILSELEGIVTHIIFMEEGHILFFKPVDQLLKESQQDNVSQAVMYYLKKSGRQL